MITFSSFNLFSGGGPWALALGGLGQQLGQWHGRLGRQLIGGWTSQDLEPSAPVLQVEFVPGLLNFYVNCACPFFLLNVHINGTF